MRQIIACMDGKKLGAEHYLNSAIGVGRLGEDHW
jgi:hypothetical protein